MQTTTGSRMFRGLPVEALAEEGSRSGFCVGVAMSMDSGRLRNSGGMCFGFAA